MVADGRWLSDDVASELVEGLLGRSSARSSSAFFPSSSSSNSLGSTPTSSIAAQFASKLFNQNPIEEEQPAAVRDSKVLYLVMQVLSNMLNTTTATSPTIPPYVDTHATPAVEVATAGSHFGVVPVIVIGVIFAVATTVGNLMVMISIRLDKQLQTISNYFLFSLAVADITIGIISIPLMTYYTSTGYWGIGWGLCQFWLSVDYLMSNASVLSLLLISFDRYFSITRPLTYRPRRTTRKALTAIFCAYLLSLILWPPWIIGWPYIEGTSTVEEGTCVVQFLAVGGNKLASQIATVGTAVAAFYLPVSIMIYLYWRVYRETRRRQEQFRHLQAGEMFTPTQIGATSALHSLMLPLHTRGSELADDQLNPEGSRRGSHISLRAAFEEFRRRGRGCFRCLDRMKNIRGIGARNAFPNESDSFKERKSSEKRTKPLLPFVDGVPPVVRPRRSKEKFSWLRYCVGKAGTEISSEESSEIVMPVNGNDWISAKAPVEVGFPLDVEYSKDINSPDGPPMTTLSTGGSGRFRSRGSATVLAETASLPPPQTPVLHTYTVLIEYKDGESKRPSVRLSSCDSEYTTTSPVDSNRSSSRRPTAPTTENGKRQSSCLPRDSSAQCLSSKTMPQTALNGKNSMTPSPAGNAQREEMQRKSEKERRKNERRQESKAAKTLSAILFAFIVTWTPYNGLYSIKGNILVIVCWEAFFPNSIPDILFTISYCLCYINPICYACNGRFLKTYMRILRCRWNERRNGSLYRHAYLRRN